MLDIILWSSNTSTNLCWPDGEVWISCGASRMANTTVRKSETAYKSTAFVRSRLEESIRCGEGVDSNGIISEEECWVLFISMNNPQQNFELVLTYQGSVRVLWLSGDFSLNQNSMHPVVPTDRSICFYRTNSLRGLPIYYRIFNLYEALLRAIASNYLVSHPFYASRWLHAMMWLSL